MWITIKADQVLYVDRGRDVILCDRNIPRELVLQLSPGTVAAVLEQIKRWGVHGGHL